MYNQSKKIKYEINGRNIPVMRYFREFYTNTSEHSIVPAVVFLCGSRNFYSQARIYSQELIWLGHEGFVVQPLFISVAEVYGPTLTRHDILHIFSYFHPYDIAFLSESTLLYKFKYEIRSSCRVVICEAVSRNTLTLASCILRYTGLLSCTELPIRHHGTGVVLR